MKTEKEYMEEIKQASSTLQLESILTKAEYIWGFWPDVFGRIIDAKLNRELELIQALNEERK